MDTPDELKNDATTLETPKSDDIEDVFNDEWQSFLNVAPEETTATTIAAAETEEESKNLLKTDDVSIKLEIKQETTTTATTDSSTDGQEGQEETTKSTIMTTTDGNGTTTASSMDVPIKDEPKREPGFVIRVRGLPWSTKETDVREFFSACQDIVAIHFTYSREGRPTGEAYIELGSSDDVDQALLKNRELLGQRYIEVFISKKDEMEFVLKRSGHHMGSSVSSFDGPDGGTKTATPDPETVVRLRGLPFACGKDDILTFFDGLEIAPDGIVFSANQSSQYGQQAGRRSKPGEAYVRFVNKETTERALDRHMNKIGHRYIEVFRSTVDEMDRMTNPARMTGGYGRSGTRPGPYSSMMGGAGGGGGGSAMVAGSGPVPLCSIPFPEFGGGGGGGGAMGGGRDRGYNDGGGRYGQGGRGNVGGGGGGAGYDPYSGYYPSAGGNGGGYYSGSGGGGGGGGGGYYGAGGGGSPSMGSSRYGARQGHVVHMRGLPYRSTANEIMEFFQPLKLVNVQIMYDERTGRPSGEAEVELCSHDDAIEAMKKDRHDMGGRYIELFINSRPQRSGVPASALSQGGGGGYGGTSSNGSGGATDMMSMMAAAGNTGGGATIGPDGVNYAASQSLVQYPGFGAYGYGSMDMSGMMTGGQAQSQQQANNPSAGGSGSVGGGGNAGYY